MRDVFGHAHFGEIVLLIPYLAPMDQGLSETKNVDFVMVFIRFIENHRSEPAGRDGGGKGTKMDPKSVHFGARKGPLWGPDSGPRSGLVSGPIWVTIWAVWGSVLGPFQGPIWGPFRGCFSVRFLVAVAPGEV